MRGCFLFEVFRAPVRITLVTAAEMFTVGVIIPFDWIPPVQSYTLMIKVNFNYPFGIMDERPVSNISIGYTIVTLVRRKINIAHLLYFRSFIIFDLIRFRRQWFKIFPFYRLKKLLATSFLSLEQQVVVTLQ